MKYFYFIYNILLFGKIYSYITFPLLKDSPSFSKEVPPSEIMEQSYKSNLYITMNIGSENIKVKTYLSLERYELMIAGNGIKNNQYNEKSSSSYNCTYCVEKEFHYGQYYTGILSTEKFLINYNGGETKTVNHMNFILGKSSIYIDPPEAFVGLILPYYDSEVEYNLFKSLKNINATNSYIWYLNLTENNSKMIIDAFPHDLQNSIYNQAYLSTTEALNEGYYL